ncbi:hypothetical protein BKI52_08650 [marine bacterium AO1-C]|nr:hypothetical protein BKI52_08650 [marine bacterium AO1-C]
MQKASRQVTDLAPRVYFLVDTSRQLSLQALRQSRFQKQFVTNKSGRVTYAKSGVVWLKFVVQADAGTYLLELKESQLADVKFYQPLANGTYQEVKRLNYYQWFLKTSHRLIPIRFFNNQPHTFYLRCYSKGIVRAPVAIGTKEAFIEKNHWEDLFQGAFFGCLVLMLLYNLFIYFSIRDLSYLYYVLYLGSITIYILMVTGHGTEFLWPHNPYLGNYNFVAFSFFWVFMFLFSNHFLNTQRYAPRLRVWANVLIVLGILPGIIGFIQEPLAELIQQILVPLACIFLITSAILVSKQYNVAKLYLLGWVGFLSGGVSVVLHMAGILRWSFDPIYLVELGALFELLFFSLALAARIKYYQQENYRLVNEQKEMLTKKVTEKTKELRDANDELLASNEELQQTQEEIAAQRDAIAEKNVLVAQSITAAQKIQRATLPFTDKLDRILPEYFILFRPRDIVSGDFYWVEKIEERLFIVALDCTGHGVPGAFMSMIANTLLDNIIKVNKITDPAEILDRLHRRVRVALRQDTTQESSGMDVALAVLQIAPGGNTSVQFVGAKRPLYYIKSSENELGVLSGTRKSIGGIQPDNVVFQTQQLVLSEGSLLYLGTDGFEDQNDVNRKKIGTKKLRNLLLTNAHLPLHAQQEVLEQALDEHMKNTKQRDDILLIGLRLA